MPESKSLIWDFPFIRKFLPRTFILMNVLIQGGSVIRHEIESDLNDSIN